MLYNYDQSYYESYIKGNSDWEKVCRRRGFAYRAILDKIMIYAPEARNILEVGCGMGFLTSILLTLPGHPNIISGDISIYALSVARDRVGLSRQLDIRRLDATALDVPGSWADLVVCFDVIEHLSDPILFFKDCHRVLRSNGVLFLSTPNTESFGRRVKLGQTLSDDAPYLARGAEWHGFRDRSHLSLKPPEEWRKIAAEKGFLKLSDGTDYLWDTPYFRCLPMVLQKLFFNYTHRILTKMSLFASWRYGENYYGIWRKI